MGQIWFAASFVSDVFWEKLVALLLGAFFSSMSIYHIRKKIKVLNKEIEELEELIKKHQAT